MSTIMILLLILIAINALSGIFQLIQIAMLIEECGGTWHLYGLISQITSILISILFCILIINWGLHGSIL